MEIEIETKNKTEVSFKEGDIVALKVDSNFDKTTETNYYLVGMHDVEDHDLYNYDYDYYLTDIKTGVMAIVTGYGISKGMRFFDRDTLARVIWILEGKVYSGDKAKLILKETK